VEAVVERDMLASIIADPVKLVINAVFVAGND
jgi:hypothetical protein